MYPVRILSFNNGWNLLNEKKEEWQNVKDVLFLINEETLQDTDVLFNEKDKEYTEGNRSGKENVEESEEDKIEKQKASYIAMVMDITCSRLLKARDWSVLKDNSYGKSINITSGMSKNKLGNFIFSTKYSAENLASIVIINSQISLLLKITDVILILIPEDNLFDNFLPEDKESLFDPFYESECRSRLAGLQSLNNLAPIVFAFFSLYESEITVEEVVFKESLSVDRAIVFPPEYYQAGVTVLSHFGEILRQKYPDINAKVRIEQDNNIVRMHIELPNGETDTIEEILEKYILVVRDKASPSIIFDNKLQIIALENKLDLVKAELKSTERVLKFALENRDEMKSAHEKAIAEFQYLVGEQSVHITSQKEQIDSLIQLSLQQNTSHERIQIAQIGHTSNLFKDLLGESHGNQVLLNALRSLEYNLTLGIATIDVQDQIRASLSTIKESNPSLLTRIAAQVEGAGYGIILPVILDLIQQHIKIQ